MKEVKKVYRFLISLGIMVIVISGSFLGSAIAMNLFVGVTVLVVIILLLAHLGVEKTVENNPKAAGVPNKLWNGKLSVIQYVVTFVCLAGSGHWVLFFTWIIILFTSLSLTWRYKEALEKSEEREAGTEKHEK